MKNKKIVYTFQKCKISLLDPILLRNNNKVEIFELCTFRDISVDFILETVRGGVSTQSIQGKTK